MNPAAWRRRARKDIKHRKLLRTKAARLRRREARRTKEEADQLRKDDRQTPPELCTEVCRRLAIVLPSPTRILEPSAGVGNFVAAMRLAWEDASLEAVEYQFDKAAPAVMGFDDDGAANHERVTREKVLQARGADVVHAGDFLSFERQWARDQYGFDLIIGNPPYGVQLGMALRFVQAAMHILWAGGHLAFLLPQSFACGQKRVKEFWRKQPGFKYYIPIAQRPSFGLNKYGKPGTDATEYAIFVWQRGFEGRATFEPHIWWRGDDAALEEEVSP